MKKIFCLQKSTNVEVELIDPNSLIGNQYIFDKLYLIKVLSLNNSVLTVKMDTGNVAQIDRIELNDFVRHLQDGSLVKKASNEHFVFESYQTYYKSATLFLLNNYDVSIDTLIFDWELEFSNLTPIETACKMALGIKRK